MNYGVLNRIAAATLVSLALASCGGSSDDEAGSPTAFATIPTEVTFAGAATAPATGCAGGTAEIAVVGGVAPYSVKTTFPDVISFNTTTVGSRGGTFRITVASGICLNPGNVIVTDKLDHVVTVKVTSTATVPAS
jgi:hypothetical protein